MYVHGLMHHIAPGPCIRKQHLLVLNGKTQEMSPKMLHYMKYYKFKSEF